MHLLNSELSNSIDLKDKFSFISCTNNENVLFLYCTLFFFSFCLWEHQDLSGRYTQLQLTPADHVFFFQMKFALLSGFNIYVSQLKMTVIKFWISIHVFFQQNSKEHQLNQSLPVFGVSWEKYIMLKLLIDTIIQFSQRKTEDHSLMFCYLMRQLS